MAVRLKRKVIEKEQQPAAPVVQQYDDAALRSEIASLKKCIEDLVSRNIDLTKQLLEKENEPELKSDENWNFDVEYNDDLTIKRIVARETSVGGSIPVKSAKTVLYG